MAAPGLLRHIRRRSRRLRGLLVASVAALSIGSVALVLATGVLHSLELLTVDARFDIRGSEPAPPQIAVVGIDDRTFDDPSLTWPFPRSLHARVIDRLRRAGAKAIAYDVQFTEPSPKGMEAQDEALFAAVERARGRIVLATTEVDPGGHTRVLGNDEFRRSLGAAVGNAVTPADGGGVIRRVFGRIQGLDSFALVAARLAGAHPRPVPKDGAWIDFHGPPGTLAFYSFGDVLHGRVPASALRGKLVVVGASAPSLQDLAATSSSGSELMSGPEIQAEAASTLMRGRPLRELPSPWPALIALLLAAVAPLGALRLRALTGFLGALALAVLYTAASQLLFDAGVIIPVVVPVGGLALGAVGSLGVLLIVEGLERQRVRDVFSHFVPSAVVDDVLARTGDEYRLGGSSRECTLLFSDLRGFTTFSEGRHPDEVIDLLNDYLAEMADAIIDHGGTLTGFLGDGIIAVFGAPLDQPDHRDRAIEAARDMLARLDAFNARVDAPDFRMGIGINTGTVMCGTVGSERRLEYTVIGDAVNTASRIEGMTKDTGHPVHVSEATIAGTTRAQGFVEIGEHAVRGRSQTIKLHGLAELAPPPPAVRFERVRPGGPSADESSSAGTTLDRQTG